MFLGRSEGRRQHGELSLRRAPRARGTLVAPKTSEAERWFALGLVAVLRV
jgi:hypothetical protein